MNGRNLSETKRERNADATCDLLTLLSDRKFSDIFSCRFLLKAVWFLVTTTSHVEREI